MAEQTEQKNAEQQTQQKPKEDTNIVHVGRKHSMNYATAILTQFNAGKKEVIVDARGRNISTAVDAVEIFRNKFITSVKIGSIDIGTQEVTDKNGRNLRVSTMKIVLKQ